MTVDRPDLVQGAGAERGASRRAPALVRWVGDRSESPGDDDDARIRKAGMILATGVIATLSFAWVGVYAYLGLFTAAAIPLTYQLVSVGTLAYFVRTRRFTPYLISQFAMILVLPFLLQATLGGFVAGSAVALWASFTPMAALVFFGPARSLPWLVAYVVLLATWGMADPVFADRAAEIPVPIALAFFVMNAAGVSLSAYAILRYFVRQRAVAAEALAEERERSERLLLNVLPAPIAERLKRDDAVIAERFEDVSVLFADIVGFTELAGRQDPDELVDLLNEIFTAFDVLAEREGLEKIKTIGDAYMIAGGLPEPTPDHCAAVARMAIGMRVELATLSRRRDVELAVRIGIDVGPVVAGVIGRRKFSYDLWGDTVNTASRMESHGLPGEVQVTPRVYERLRDTFDLVPRGVIDVKGKGSMATFLLRG